MKLVLNDSAKKILFLLIATDLLFICLHIFYKFLEYGVLDLGGRVNLNESFFLNRDRSYPELFQYIKEYWIAISLGFLAWKNKSFSYTNWCLLFTYLLLDDFFSIHEKAGFIISERLEFISIFRLRSVDYGELIVLAFFGIVFFSLIAIAYRYSNKIERRISKNLIRLILALAFFGIITDIIHVMVESQLLGEILAIIEDGGEHIVMSAIVGFAYFLFEQTGKDSGQRVGTSEIAEPENSNYAKRLASKIGR